jgi:hypothetical protein
MRTEARALTGLQRLHENTERAAEAIGAAPELSEPVRAALLAEVDTLAIRIGELARVAHGAAELHQLAADLQIVKGRARRG